MCKYLLVGNPNSGKTTLFNALTASREKTGNFYGVTATTSKSGYKLENKRFEVIDLPGIYSLKPYSLEEQNAVKQIYQEEYDFIVCLIDALSPLGGLELVRELLPLNKRLIIGVTKLEGLTKRGGKLDLKRLEQVFGVEVVAVNAKSAGSVKAFKERLKNNNDKRINDFNSDKIVREVFFPPKRQSLDKALLNPLFCFVLCLIIFSAVFFIAFSPYSLVSLISKKIENGFEIICQALGERLINGGVSKFVTTVLQKGLNSCGAVLGFLPQLITLNFFMLLLEESGIASRYSILLAKLLKRGGLSGKSIFPLVSSLGCTSVSCRLCNSSENEKIKLRTLSCLPFVPCSAKNAVFLFLCSRLFPYPFVAIILIYSLHLGGLIIYSRLAERLNPTEKLKVVVELAPLVFPDLKSVLYSSLGVAISFFKKIFLSVLLVSITLAIFTSLDKGFNYTDEIQNSLLAIMGKKISIAFRPIGLEDWQIVVALLCGLFAKETTVGVISMLYGEAFTLGLASAVSLIVFFSAYPPCFIALSAFNQERRRLGFKIFIKHLLIGYIGALFTFNLLTKRLVFSIIILSLIIVGWLVYENRYCKYKRKIISNCGKRGCRIFSFTKALSQKGRKGKRKESK